MHDGVAGDAAQGDDDGGGGQGGPAQGEDQSQHLGLAGWIFCDCGEFNSFLSTGPVEARFHRRKREKDVTLPFLQEDLVQVGFYIFYCIQVMNFHLSAKLLSQTLMWCLRWTNLLNDNPHW